MALDVKEELQKLIADAWNTRQPSPGEHSHSSLPELIERDMASAAVVHDLVDDLIVMIDGICTIGDFSVTVEPARQPIISFKLGKFEFEYHQGIVSVSSWKLKRKAMECPLWHSGMKLDLVYYLAIRSYLSFDKWLLIQGTDDLPLRLRRQITQ
jgi:hypothetical protein